ncbi:uncharacterized protein LOC142558026 [Dermacentor variabilis]|uniref:uncharacterized protein LOC142558026 n=1 Tax=Dermacentor variabilis TaxID=34621 RepID=UPI003F5CBACC
MQYYASCSSQEKALLKKQEEAYQRVQWDLVYPTMCELLDEAADCVNKDVMKGCRVRLQMKPNSKAARKNFLASKNLTDCMRKAAEPCPNTEQRDIRLLIESFARDVAGLFRYNEEWHEPVETPTPNALTKTTSTAPQLGLNTSASDPPTRKINTHSTTIDPSTVGIHVLSSANQEKSTAYGHTHKTTTEKPTMKRTGVPFTSAGTTITQDQTPDNGSTHGWSSIEPTTLDVHNVTSATNEFRSRESTVSEQWTMQPHIREVSNKPQTKYISAQRLTNETTTHKPLGTASEKATTLPSATGGAAVSFAVSLVGLITITLLPAVALRNF